MFSAGSATVAKTDAGNSVQRIIHEAENLSLNKDRVLACSVLWRFLKKASKEDAKPVREKLFQLSRYYYTDRGFQAFLGGKDLFDKQKYQDALERFLEADDLESGNVEVLHYLALTQLWLKKGDQAEATNKRALQMCPIDVELIRDQLAIQVYQEKWADAVTTAQSLSKENGDASATTLEQWGVALIKNNETAEGRKLLDQAAQKDPKLPETYWWQADQAANEAEASKFLAKYIELCKNKTQFHYEREVDTCSHSAEAEKRIKL